MSDAGRTLALARRQAALAGTLGAEIATALQDPQVVEVLINSDGKLWIERVGQGMQSTDIVFSAPSREAAIRLLAHEAGQSVSEDNPALATTLPTNGARVQAILPPLVEASVLAIRKRPDCIFGLDDYIGQGAMTLEQASALRLAVRERRNIVVAGGTGSGKTTLLNALLAEPDFASARVVILEDTHELQCASPNRVQLLTKASAPTIDMRALVRMTMRLRPDRIVVGEVRDGAALEVLKAWNTGHPGGLLSLHANSASEAVTRLEDLAGEASLSSTARLVAQAVDVIVFMARTPGGRRVSEILQLH